MLRHSGKRSTGVRFRVACLVLVALASSLGVKGQGRPAGTLSATTTVLSDGRTLLTGGESRGRVSGDVTVMNARTGETVAGPRLLVPRAGHSATLLPDGRVLVLGGVNADGEPVELAERIDLGTGVTERIPFEWRARAGHTATLLDSSHVFVAGGQVDGHAVDAAELVNFETGSLEKQIVLDERRTGHSASLLSDGRVRLSGGAGADRATNGAATIVDAVAGVATPGSQVQADDLLPSLSASEPAAGASDVPLHPRLMLRFSRPGRRDTLNPATVALSGPHGTVEVQIVSAEDGRLLFVTPSKTLDPASSYLLVVDGALDTAGRKFPVLRLSFTTAGTTASSMSDEEWTPASGQDWQTNRPRSRWQDVSPLQGPPGVTALSGQILRLNGSPLSNVEVELESVRARTDSAGRFLLATPDASPGWHELWVDGNRSRGRGDGYGTYEVAVPLSAGRTTVLPFTIWLTKIDTANAVTIPTPTRNETVITTPKIPGLELRLPAGAVIKDEDGEVVNEVSITPIPLDRPPFPLPAGVDVPIYFTIQPGGAYVEVPSAGTYRRGARLIYPNYRGRPANTPMEFWHYEPEDGRTWYVYGNGQVSPDGRQVVPDRGVSIYEFTGAMVAPPIFAPPTWAQIVAFFAGDPVDLGTGLFVLEATDLRLPDTLPISIERTYRQNDIRSRAFGIGASLGYDFYLILTGSGYSSIDLVLPSGTRIKFARISPGSQWYDAVLESQSGDTAFYKARMDFSNGWRLTLKDGTFMRFPDSLWADNPSQAAVREIIDRYGNETKLERSAAGDLTRVTSPNGRYIEFAYDAGHRITEAHDNIGRSVQYTYDASGRLWKVTDVRGGVTEYTYDGGHRMLTIKDPRGIVYLTNEYDANGRVSKQTQADSTTFEFAYTLNGSGTVTQTQVTDPRGYVRQVSFDSDGYPTTDTYALGQSVARSFTYEWQTGTKFLAATVDPLGRRTEQTFDLFGNLSSVTRLAGTANPLTDSFTYEPKFNQLASSTDALSQQAVFEYDANGALARIRDPLNHVTSLESNGTSQVTAVVDALGNRTELHYQGGDLVRRVDPLGRETKAFVDGAGRMLTSTDANGRQTRYEYNAKDQVTKVIDPLGHETSFSYDLNGRLLTLTDAQSNTTTYAHNSMDRLATRTDPLARVESFEYDANGNLVEYTDRKSQITVHAYDPLNRLTNTVFADSSTTTNTFDAGDRLTQVVDSIGGTISRGYDLHDGLTSESTPEGSVSFTYDELGRRESMTVAGQATVNYAYDASSRLTNMSQASSTVELGYDAANRRTSLTLPNGIVVAYDYDDASQLLGLTYSAGATTLGALSYGFDHVNRRTTVGGSWARTGLPGALTLATYDAANQLTGWDGATVSYDANGNISSDGQRTFVWNARNQLESISGTVSANFSYDGLGRRRGKTVNSVSTNFLHDGLNTVQELSGGTVSANLLPSLGLDETFSRTDGTGTRHLLGDALGSTVALSDAAGVVQTQYTYEPFGGTSASGASDGNSAQFTARENDGTGLYYYRSRYLHTAFQRFAGEDPIGFAAGDPNLHSYVFNAPTRFTDPTGQVVGAMLIGCALSAGSSAAGDAMAGRKMNWPAAVGACAVGAMPPLAAFAAAKAAPPLIAAGMAAVGSGARAAAPTGPSIAAARAAAAADAVAAAQRGARAADSVARAAAQTTVGQAVVGVAQGIGYDQASSSPPAPASRAQAMGQAVGQAIQKVGGLMGWW